jgi:hypothetical protein
MAHSAGLAATHGAQIIGTSVNGVPRDMSGYATYQDLRPLLSTLETERTVAGTSPLVLLSNFRGRRAALTRMFDGSF